MSDSVRHIKVCAVIPTYNNAGTLRDVIARTLEYVDWVIVVNDGSTDATSRQLDNIDSRVTVISYETNRGKGHALQTGLDYARDNGFTHAVTLDADGQHYPEDIPVMLDALHAAPEAIILGNRGMTHDNMNSQSTFANRFSNFWFAVQTFCRPGDTQTGFRVYPLNPRRRFFTSRYEAELAVLVHARWNGTPVLSVPVRVYYPPKEERVSHFRPGRDFARISLLNTILCFLAVVYGYPSMFFHYIKRRVKR